MAIAFLLIAYFAEVMISVTCLEFSYTQATRTMKSMIFGLFMASVAIGNFIYHVCQFFIINDDGSTKLAGADYYLFFSGLLFQPAVIFIPIAKFILKNLFTRLTR